MVALVRLARQRIGGVTGDVYGLVVEVCEVMVLLVCTDGLVGCSRIL